MIKDMFVMHKVVFDDYDVDCPNLDGPAMRVHPQDAMRNLQARWCAVCTPGAPLEKNDMLITRKT